MSFFKEKHWNYSATRFLSTRISVTRVLLTGTISHIGSMHTCVLNRFMSILVIYKFITYHYFYSKNCRVVSDILSSKCSLNIGLDVGKYTGHAYYTYTYLKDLHSYIRSVVA